MITEETLVLAKQIWDYHHLNNTIEKADCILVLGSHDVRVAERAAELHLNGCAPLLIFSGGLGRLTEGVWSETEADLFAKIAIDKGVPWQAILTENKSSNTGENILFTGQLLKKKIWIRTHLLSCKSPIWKDGVLRHLKNTGRRKR